MQRKIFVLIGFALSVTFANSLWVEAAEGDIKPEFESDKAPGGRVPGGTRYMPDRALNLSRGWAKNSNILTVLAPKGTGYTINKQPRLYWHISELIKNPVELTIIYVDPLAEDVSTEPLLETQLQVFHAGLQVIDLSKYNIELKTGVEYEWFINIVSGKRGFNRTISRGTIQRIDQPNELMKKIENAKEKERPLIYAEAELWYDAVSSLSDLIDKYPKDKTLKNQQLELFKQVGLKNIKE